MTLDSRFAPAEIEPRLYEGWENAGSFACDPDSNATPFTIMIPPPNVTGSLHMGHALTFTIQDTLIRWRRMQGRDALWQPGTDHAGIATQMVVERLLAEEGKDRRDLGRDAFVERVWQWKAESGGTITRQLRRLGASLDWPRERFTMDDGLSAAVKETFVTLYEEGLIYRDRRLVNWDPKLQTAISDLEVENREIKGSLWYLRYPIEGEPGQSIIVATTRPETMLGDTAVAVHPDHPVYGALIGKRAILPLVGRSIPIIADTYADPEKGTGAVKITPAHDFNDFEVGRRHDLPMPSVLDRQAMVTLAEIEDVLTAVPGVADPAVRPLAGRSDAVCRPQRHRGRTGTPGTARQDRAAHQPGAAWRSWRRAGRAAADHPVVLQRRRAGQAGDRGGGVRQDRIRAEAVGEHLLRLDARYPALVHFAPALVGPSHPGLVRTGRHGLRRQGRGRRRCPGARIITATTKRWCRTRTYWTPGSVPACGRSQPWAGRKRPGNSTRYYPGDVLVTGFDIIFFWVARMMMLGLHMMGDVPFREVYIHGLVRDERGQKMSKSRGNVIDPLELIDRYGADALRFTICALTGPGRDVKLSAARVEDYRGFVTKLWNAARFCEMNGMQPGRRVRSKPRRLAVVPLAAGRDQRRDPGTPPMRWRPIVSTNMPSAAYRFVWNTFCDWFLEFAKPLLADGADPVRCRRNPRRGRLCAGPDPAPAASRDPVRHRRIMGSFRLR